MKITNIKTHMARFGNRPRGLIKVETDEGLYGWGEAYSVGPDLSVEPIANYIFEMIKGEDPRRIEYIMMKIHQQFRFPAGGRVWRLSPLSTMHYGISAAKLRIFQSTCSLAGPPVIESASIGVSVGVMEKKQQTAHTNSMKNGASPPLRQGRIRSTLTPTDGVGSVALLQNISRNFATTPQMTGNLPSTPRQDL